MVTSGDGFAPSDRHSDGADANPAGADRPPLKGDLGMADPGPSPGKPDTNTQPSTWALAGIGLELAGGVAVFSLIGWWLDARYSTGPWLLVLGGMLGVIGGMYNLWKQARRYL
jgi:hypothetical protein